MRASLRSVAIAMLLIGSRADLVADAAHTRVLVPLYIGEVPGAYGSLWKVDSWIYYSGGDFVDIVPRAHICRILCEGPGGQLVPGLAPMPLEPEFSRDAGVLMHIPRDQISAVELSSRVRDVSRDADSAGTEVPVVREDKFRAGSLYLLNVPLGAGRRTALRIYSLPETASPEVEVRYYRMPFFLPEGNLAFGEVILLRTERVQLRTYPPTAGFLLHPSFILIGNVGSLPELIAESSVWIEVRPVTAGLRLWAMASITNDTTQQVTLVTPMQH